MAYATIVKEFTFDAAHKLEGYNGLCKNLHGHTYKLQVGIYGKIKNVPGATDDGMVLDFVQLKQVIKEKVIDKLDHQYINDIVSFRPTSENIALWMISILKEADIPVKFIRLYETPTSYVEINEGDIRE